MSTYNPNFPVDGFPLDNFAPIVQNWNSLNDTFAVDHAPFNDPSDVTNGHHKHVRFYDVAGVPTLTNPQAQLYTKTVAIPGDMIRALFFAEKPDTGAQIERQLTDLSNLSANPLIRIYDLPWGWRLHLINTSGNVTIGGINPPILANRWTFATVYSVAPAATRLSVDNATQITYAASPSGAAWSGMIISMA